jgi:hypothetical protein
MNIRQVSNVRVSILGFRLLSLACTIPVILLLASGTASGALIVDYLVVGGGGGGGGGAQSSNNGGGGGGGGFLSGTLALSPSTYSVAVGAGGVGGANPDISQVRSTSGGLSQFDTIVAAGGGAGGGGSNGGLASSIFNYPALSGGSGGGGDLVFNPTGAAGNTPATVPAQGFSGGNGASPIVFPFEGGGGGGAGEVGNADGLGFGGDGLASSITGASVFYAGGGGGGQDPPAANSGIGGGGVGGNGAVPIFAATAGTNGLGGGGGGGGSQGVSIPGADGGSGIVIVRYLLDSSFDQAIGGIESVVNIDGLDYGLHVFNQVGSSFDFVVNDPPPAPEPSTCLLCLGVLGLFRQARRRSGRA